MNDLKDISGYKHASARLNGSDNRPIPVNTLGILLREAGFIDVRSRRVGRGPDLAKSMVAVASSPRPTP